MIQVTLKLVIRKKLQEINFLYHLDLLYRFFFQLKHFYAKGFTANRAVVAGVNIDPSLLKEFAETLPLENGDPNPGNGAYFGGEIRKDKYGRTSQIAIAAEGAGLKDPKSALAFGVLQYAVGVASSVPWGVGASPLQKAVSAAGQGNAGASAINVSYSDSGLFGVVVSASADAAGKVGLMESSTGKGYLQNPIQLKKLG